MSTTKKFNTDLPHMNHERSGCAAAALSDKIFVLGGWTQSIEMYNTTTKQWTTLPNSMSTARFSAAAVSYRDNIIVMGGLDDITCLSSVEQYSTISQQWSSFPTMNSKRWGCAAAVLNGKIYVMGGFDGSHSLATVEEYDPATQRWSKIAPMMIRRNGCAAAVCRGQLYVVGGWNYDGSRINHLSSAEVYDPTTKQWAFIADMSTARDGCAVVSSSGGGGKIVVVGGHDGSAYLSSCEAYDTSTHQWSSIPSMYTKRAYGAAVEVEGILYVVGGHDGNNHLSSMESLVIQRRTPRFYLKLFEEDKRNVHCKIEELMNIVQDVHQMKFFYTLVNNSYRSKSVTQQDRKRYIATSLKKVASSTTCYDSLAIFKQLLDKARQDAILTDHEYYTLDRMADLTHTSTAPFFKEVWESLEFINTRVVPLENRVDILDACVDNLDGVVRMNSLESRVKRLEELSVNVVESLQMLRKGIRRKEQVEARTGMLSAVLNAVSFGFAVSVAQGVMGEVINSIIDFGDLYHIQTVVRSFGDAKVNENFQYALDTISDRRTAANGRTGLREPTVEELMAAAKEGNPLFAIVVTALIISQEYDYISQGITNSHVSESFDSMSLNHQKLSNASTKEICKWLPSHGISTESLDIICREEIDGTFFFTELLDEIKMILREEGIKVGQISKICRAIEKAKREGYLA